MKPKSMAERMRLILEAEPGQQEYFEEPLPLHAQLPNYNVPSKHRNEEYMKKLHEDLKDNKDYKNMLASKPRFGIRTDYEF
jgi:hypothetical protein